ncbi:putative cyclic nucleotide-gated ion channel 14 [Hibiscus syriacus]|uniref:Cyclic nucleotide-gated ion channel 14 n=1 Tax=Hibiscus syriacus TaxID=106335 RepID=A0A6A3BYV4_HIBSY|nr:putative cyclic nucleotide-gated ion channel 14 [Hibiscus syriacus]
MDSGKSKSVRFRDDPEKNTCSSPGRTHSSKFMSKVTDCNQKTATGKTFHKKELSRAKRGLCITVSLPLEIDLTIVRSVVDVFYILQIFVRFRTAYVAPSSRVFGRGELVIDPSKIASRLYLIYPLSSQIIKTTGVVTATAWAGAAYNLVLYMLASHVLGAAWYLLSLERQEECWMEVCNLPLIHCPFEFFDCRSIGDPARSSWLKSSNISSLCDPSNDFFQFGIYGDALRSGVTSEGFFKKYFYCLWWGLRNLSSLGQGLFTSTSVGEIIFVIIIAILGLVLFALLIGNMQTYLQSTTVRLEEWRIRRTDMEQWMHHRQLPYELRKNVRRYDQYRWVATRGVDEEAILKSLPADLRRDIKRHLCLDLVRQVPLFDLMDDQMLDAICERLKPCLCTPSTCLVREGDPVNEMLFIVRGHLDSCTTNGGRTGFFNSSRIGPGDFCGEELLTWALDPCPSIVLPSSTRTVKAITEVEAFALVSEDLKFVASQFRRLHSKKLKHTFRFHSHQWRTWAACFIQAAWLRYKRRKEDGELKKWESMVVGSPEKMMEQTTGAPVPAVAVEFASYAAKLAASTRSRGGSRSGNDLDILSSLQKPNEPDFTVEEI